MRSRAFLLVLVLGACGDDSGSARPDAPVVVAVAGSGGNERAIVESLQGKAEID